MSALVTTSSSSSIHSTTRMYSASCARNGYPLPGQVRYGKDGGIRVGHPSAVGTHGKRSVRAGYVPHSRVGLPDQQGVRTVLEVHAKHQGGRVLRWSADPEGRGGPEIDQPAHHRRNAGTRFGPHPQQKAEPETPEAFHSRRVRQNA